MTNFAPAQPTLFLTIWLCLDALLNGACGIGYFFFPKAFFAGIGGPYGDDVTPNLTWTVRTQASYFILSSGAMIATARSRDTQIRRHLITAFTIPGVLQIPAAIIRGTEEGGNWRTTLVSVVIVCVICAPYVFFTLIKHEENISRAWWRRKSPSGAAQDGSSQ